MLRQFRERNDRQEPGRRHYRSLVISGVDRVLNWLEVARQRRLLATFDDRMLSDIGVGHADAWHETHRHFWDVPDNRS